MSGISRVALLLVDVINHFEFPDGKELLRQALAVAPALARLKRRARKAGIPTIYVNDNFGQWRSDTKKLLILPEARSAGSSLRRTPSARRRGLFPYPMHSAFYQTPLDLRLRELGASSLILTGLTTNKCILCTAHDADMRHLKVIVPGNCCAARRAPEHRQDLEHIAAMADAKVVMSSTTLRLGASHG